MTVILLDSTPLPKQPVGAGIYIKTLVKSLLQITSNFHFRVLAHKDDFVTFNLDESFRDHFIFCNDHGRAVRLLSEQLRYPALIHHEKIDLFHGLHYSFPFFTACPKIVTIHDLTYFTNPEQHIFLKRIYFKFFIKQACKKVDHILTISKNTQIDLLKMINCNSQKITVTQLGVDDVYFEEATDFVKEKIKQKYNLPNDFLLFIGLIEPRKNVPLLIKAFLNLADQNKIDCDLVIAGRWGWESEAILSEISTHPANSKIHFIGYVDESEKPALFQLAKIFVYPSMYEGFGLPVLEAMASGTPVITTNISSMPEIVKDCGVLIEPNDMKALENAMILLINDHGLRCHFSSKAKLRSKDFSWQNTVNLTIEAYEKVLHNKGKF